MAEYKVTFKEFHYFLRVDGFLQFNYIERYFISSSSLQVVKLNLT